MRITDALQNHVTFSFEVFPPKQDRPLEPLMDTLAHLYAFRPDYISVTCGAGGSNKGRNLEIVRSVQESGVCPALAHFTCIGNSRADVLATLDAYERLGVQNVLALRGDLPKDWTGTGGDFAHADELIPFIKAHNPAMCVGAACYPELHIQADSFETDIDALKRKQDAGAGFFTTQLCYDVDAFCRFMDKVRAAGVTVPLVAGVMPVLSRDPVIRMCVQNGCSVPRELSRIIGRCGEDQDAFRQAGKVYTAQLFRWYLNAGINGLHIYTLNRYRDVSDIIALSGVR